METIPTWEERHSPEYLRKNPADPINKIRQMSGMKASSEFLEELKEQGGLEREKREVIYRKRDKFFSKKISFDTKKSRTVFEGLEKIGENEWKAAEEQETPKNEGSYEQDGEYHRFSESADVRRDLEYQKKSSKAETALTAVAAIMLIFLAFSHSAGSSLKIFYDNPKAFAVTNTVILGVAVLANLRTVLGGIAAVFRGRIIPGTVAAAAVVPSLIYNILLIFKFDQLGDGIYDRMFSGAAALCLLIFGVYLQPAVTQVLGITPDAWMQDRYYRYYGVLTGFMTNLTNLEIDKPEGYSEQAVDDILDNVAESEKFSTGPMYAGSYAATTPKEEQAKQPTIIYVMDESYWDVSELEQYGITFDTDVSQNLHALQQTSAYGRAYSPSFGGGTCDVEFEALTGYSVSFLPSGSKPYQQHVTKPMFALPNYLKLKGYQTAAVHCFWAKYWSRDKAYPNLGFSDFISLEDMHGVTKVRKHYWTSGLVTDDSMADQIIQQYEKMSTSSDKPIFLHAVTMQNHTNYNRDNYPDDERVHVVSHPVGLKSSTVGALEDFATGIRDADAMLGKLTAYFSQVDEPVILVFWGDHYNPIDSNYDVYTTTSYASGSSTDPRLHQTTLLMWSNYSQQKVDFGTIAAYDISPVMMELFGLEQPLYFQFLNRQLRVASRSCTRGTTMNLDGTTTQQPTEFQQRWTNEHWMLQYDLMFGKGYALNRMGVAGLSGMNTGK